MFAAACAGMLMALKSFPSTMEAARAALGGAQSFSIGCRALMREALLGRQKGFLNLSPQGSGILLLP